MTLFFYKNDASDAIKRELQGYDDANAEERKQMIANACSCAGRAYERDIKQLDQDWKEKLRVMVDDLVHCHPGIDPEIMDELKYLAQNGPKALDKIEKL